MNVWINFLLYILESYVDRYVDSCIHACLCNVCWYLNICWFSKLHFFLKQRQYFLNMFYWRWGACHGTHVEFRGQFANVSPPLPMWTWGWNGGHQAGQQVSLLTDSSCKLQKGIFMIRKLKLQLNILNLGSINFCCRNSWVCFRIQQNLF